MPLVTSEPSEPLKANLDHVERFLGLVQRDGLSALMLNVQLQMILQVTANTWKTTQTRIPVVSVSLCHCVSYLMCLHPKMNLSRFLEEFFIFFLFQLPGRCWTTETPSGFRSSAFPTPDSIRSWGELIAPPLIITSLSAKTWGESRKMLWEVSMSNSLQVFAAASPSYRFRLSFLCVFYTHGPLAIKQDLGGQAAHLCLQVGSTQNGSQIGAGCTPPLSWTD